jgi:chromosome segregation ATPase
MEGDTLTLIVQIIVVIVTAGSGWFLLRRQRAKMDVEMTDTAVSTVQKVLEELRTELARSEERIAKLEKKVGILTQEKEAMRAELQALRRQIATLRRGVTMLTEQIKQLGHEPVWTGEEEEDDQ